MQTSAPLVFEDGAIRLKVAIKRLKNPCKSVRHLVRLPEVEALRRISHPNVVECKSVVLERNGFPYLVFEFVSGGDLGALVSRTGPLPELQVIDIARQLLLAVRHMHNKGFMHRDIKPDNVLVANGTRPESSVYPHVATEPYSVTVKLADLGIARNYRDKRSRASSAKEGTRVSTRCREFGKLVGFASGGVYSHWTRLQVLYRSVLIAVVSSP